jgi:hypothetical protein
MKICESCGMPLDDKTTSKYNEKYCGIFCLCGFGRLVV